MERKSMGSFIAALRKANGLTQKQLAERLDVSDKAVSRWERDECAPDISIIPALTEIFGITADELLCGERKADNEDLNPRRTAKQKNRIITNAVSTFKKQSLIPIGISALAIISGVLLEFFISNHAITMIICGIIVAISVICQFVFLGNSKNTLSGEDFDDINTDSLKKDTVHFSKCIFAFNFAIVFIYISLLFYLPFCSGIDASFADMFAQSSGFDSIFIAILYALSGIIVFKLLWNIILKHFIKSGYYPADDNKIRLARFRSKFSLICTIVLCVTLLASSFVNDKSFANVAIKSDSIVFEKPEEFKKFMETEESASYCNLKALTLEFVTPDKVEIAEKSENYSEKSENYLEVLKDQFDNTIIEYKCKNQSVRTIDYDNVNMTITVTTTLQFYQALLTLRLITVSVFTVELLVMYVLYAILIKRLKGKVNS